MIYKDAIAPSIICDKILKNLAIALAFFAR
jgi:hypothetical protein